jgi:hypothetical protein
VSLISLPPPLPPTHSVSQVGSAQFKSQQSTAMTVVTVGETYFYHDSLYRLRTKGHQHRVQIPAEHSYVNRGRVFRGFFHFLNFTSSVYGYTEFECCLWAVFNFNSRVYGCIEFECGLWAVCNFTSAAYGLSQARITGFVGPRHFSLLGPFEESNEKYCWN